MNALSFDPDDTSTTVPDLNEARFLWPASQDIPGALRRLRKRQTYQQAAYRIGVSTTSWWAWENDIRVPAKLVCARIARRFEVPLDWLLSCREVSLQDSL